MRKNEGIDILPMTSTFLILPKWVENYVRECHAYMI